MTVRLDVIVPFFELIELMNWFCFHHQLSYN
jgi:hypothetical protein